MPTPPSDGLDPSPPGEEYRALTVLTPNLVFIVDSDMRVVLANAAAARFVDRSLDEVKGARVADLFGPTGAEFEARVCEAAANGRSLDFEDSFGTGEETRWMKTSLVPLADVVPGFVVGESRDITDSRVLQVALQGAEDEVNYLATHDALTGVANRRAFVAALGRAVALAKRGTRSTVFCMDVDLFKQVNDERGHAFGDDTLAKVASLLQGEVRDVDLVARLGGDEFAALLTESSDAGTARVAERMTASVEALGVGIGVRIGLSIGIASVDPDGDVDRIMSTADHRMYAQKTVHREVRKTPR